MYIGYNNESIPHLMISNIENPAHPITSGHKSPPEQPNHPVRRSVRIKEKMSEIAKSNSQIEIRPKFYGSVDASGRFKIIQMLFNPQSRLKLEI